MPQAPGTQKQVFDYDLLYKVGAASAPGSSRYRQQRETPWIAKMAFQFLGNQVLNYVSSSQNKRRKFTSDNEIYDAKFAATIGEDQGMSDTYSDAVLRFSEQRDEGQRLVSKYHGFPKSKKYKKGVALMNAAQMKLGNLEKDANLKLTYANQYKGQQLNGSITDQEGKTTPTELAEYNAADVDERTLMLMNGELDRHLQVNEDTGHLELVEEVHRGGFGPEGLLDESEIKITPFNEIKFNKFRDDTALTIESDAKTAGSALGEQGLSWDESMEMGIRADADSDISKLTPSAFKSWFFSGTHYKYRDAGKNFMTPAEHFLKEKYPDIYQGMIDGDEFSKMQYEGLYDSLKQQNMEEGDEYKEFAIQSIVDVAKQYHEISKAVYDEKNKKEIKYEKPEKEGQLFIDKGYGGGKLDPAHAKRMAFNMYDGAGTEYSIDGNTKFVQDGKGYTTIYARETETVTEKNEFGETVNVTKGRGDYIEGDTITTEEALKRRGLSTFYNSPYTAVTEEAKVEDQDQADEEVLEGLNTKEKTVVKITDSLGKEVDPSEELSKGIYAITYDDGSTERKIVK